MSGFRREKSSIDNVLTLVSSIEEMKIQKKKITALFIDIKAAFDTVEHNAILLDMKNIGFEGPVVTWI